MNLKWLKWIALTFLLNSFGSKGTISAICSGKSTQKNVTPSQLDGLEGNLFLSNWNGLTGVVAGTGTTSSELPVNGLCKVYVETVPDPSKSKGAKFYLWSNETCQPQGKRWLYLAFPKGYVKFDFTAKSSVEDPQAMASSSSVRKNFIAAKIFSRSWSISRDLRDLHGPADATDIFDRTVSYNPYAHIVEEIKIQPSSTPVVNDFLALVTEKQLNRRRQLVPASLEPDLDVFRNFFLEKEVIKRLLVDFSQGSGIDVTFNSPDPTNWSRPDYRFCPVGTSVADCEQEQQRVSEALQKSLSPELWSAVAEYFYPTNNTITNFESVKLLSRQPLNDALRKLFKPEAMWLRVPQESPEVATLVQRAFNDQLFQLPTVAEYALTSSPLVYVEPQALHNLGLIKNLQPTTFCTDSSKWESLFRETRLIAMGTNNLRFSFGAGPALIGWGGIVPFAFKRPRWATCGFVPPASAGGASITPLPAVTEDNMVPEGDLASAVERYPTVKQPVGESQPATSEGTAPTNGSSPKTSCLAGD